MDPILGYRVICAPQSGKDLPSSPHRRYLWSPDTQLAACDRSGHPAPEADCECGLYAFHLLTDAINWADRSGTVAAVMGFGKTFIHSDRYRTEQMKVLAVLDDPLLNIFDQKLVAGYFSVPLLPARTLVNYATEFATLRFKNNQPPPLLPLRPWRHWSAGDYDFNVRALDNLILTQPRPDDHLFNILSSTQSRIGLRLLGDKVDLSLRMLVGAGSRLQNLAQGRSRL